MIQKAVHAMKYKCALEEDIRIYELLSVQVQKLETTKYSS